MSLDPAALATMSTPPRAAPENAQQGHRDPGITPTGSDAAHAANAASTAGQGGVKAELPRRDSVVSMGSMLGMQAQTHGAGSIADVLPPRRGQAAGGPRVSPTPFVGQAMLGFGAGLVAGGRRPGPGAGQMWGGTAHLLTGSPVRVSPLIRSPCKGGPGPGPLPGSAAGTGAEGDCRPWTESPDPYSNNNLTDLLSRLPLTPESPEIEQQVKRIHAAAIEQSVEYQRNCERTFNELYSQVNQNFLGVTQALREDFYRRFVADCGGGGGGQDWDRERDGLVSALQEARQEAAVCRQEMCQMRSQYEQLLQELERSDHASRQAHQQSRRESRSPQRWRQQPSSRQPARADPDSDPSHQAPSRQPPAGQLPRGEPVGEYGREMFAQYIGQVAQASAAAARVQVYAHGGDGGGAGPQPAAADTGKPGAHDTQGGDGLDDDNERRFEPQIDRAKMKTKLCKYYQQTGRHEACAFYKRHGWCAFAHGEKEISQSLQLCPPDMSLRYAASPPPPPQHAPMLPDGILLTAPHAQQLREGGFMQTVHTVPLQSQLGGGGQTGGLGPPLGTIHIRSGPSPSRGCSQQPGLPQGTPLLAGQQVIQRIVNVTGRDCQRDWTQTTLTG